MYLLEGNADDNGNFFDGHNQWDWIKVFYILIHVLLTLLVPCLLYSICWYERYSPDLQYRAVSNILLSHSCWIGIIRSFLVRIPSVLVIVFGPFDPWTCNTIFSSARFSFMIFLNELIIWQLVRLFVITKGTKIIVVDDDFVAFFLTLGNVFLTATFTFSVDFMAFRVTEMDYHICLGDSPYRTITKFSSMPWFEAHVDPVAFYKDLVYRDPMGVLFRLELPLLLVIAMVSWCISNRGQLVRFFRSCCCHRLRQPDTETPAEEESDANNNNNFRRRLRNDDFEHDSSSGNFIVSAGTSFAGMVIFIILLIPETLYKNLKNPAEDVNHGPGRKLMYLCRVTMPLLSYCLFPTIILCNNSKMRSSIFKELKNLF